MKYVIAYDIGTTGVKTCIFAIENKIELIASSAQAYNLYTFPNGGAEQNHEEWWNSMCQTTKDVFNKCNIKPNQIEGISFCSQAQGLILVDKNGVPVRMPMSYMDQRAIDVKKKYFEKGLIKVAGANLFKLLKCLAITKAAPTSVKDPCWKYKWVEEHEPENFKKVYKWLDVKDYLICRCTGKFATTEDNAFATMIFDNRPNKKCFSKPICKMLKINMDHLPKVLKATDCFGTLTKKAADELGLVPGIKVFGGGGDNSIISVGAGCNKPGDTHIYVGTSGWVSTLTKERKVDINSMIAAISYPQEGLFNYFAEMETAGKCFDWVMHHLALDEIDLYLTKVHVAESPESQFKTLYEYLNYTIKDIEPGSNGVLFTPWLHGNRCPFEDANASGMFFGIKLDTGKKQLIRSVLEGICYHLRWMLESCDKKVQTASTIRFVGGGAVSPVTCQILADILNRKIETVCSPQNVGAVGAAGIVGVGLGIIPSLEVIDKYIPINDTYIPNYENHLKYEKYYQTFKKLYKSNKNIYRDLKETN